MDRKFFLIAELFLSLLVIASCSNKKGGEGDSTSCDDEVCQETCAKAGYLRGSCQAGRCVCVILPDAGYEIDVEEDTINDMTPDGGETSGDLLSEHAGTDGELSSDLDAIVTLRGEMDKGPFILGSTIIIYAIDASGVPSGQIFTTSTQNHFGEFSLELAYTGFVQIEGNGYYFNEATGAISESWLTLRAYHNIEDAGEQVANLNLITHLTFERVAFLVDEGMSITDAIEQAESELVAALGIGPDGFELETSGIGISLQGGDNDATAYLLAVSSILALAGFNRYYYAEARSYSSPHAALQELLNMIAVDLSTDGSLDPDLVNEFGSIERSMSPEAVMHTVARRFGELGSTAQVPDINRILDQDSDGHVNRDDCMRHDPTMWTGHADLDGDGHDYYRCGGDDCDDDCPTCYPGAPPSCGEARDHDCDGLADEYSGCGNCVPGVPFVVGQVNRGDQAADLYDVFVVGDHALLNWSPGVWVVDVSEPDAPLFVGGTESGGGDQIDIYGDYLFGQGVVDISDPTTPTVITDHLFYPVEGYIEDYFDVTKGILYSSGHFVDIHAPEHTVYLGTIAPWETCLNSRFQGTTTAHGYVYIVGQETSQQKVLFVYDMSDPINPLEVSRIGLPHAVSGTIFYSDGYLYIGWETGALILETTDPTSPTIISEITTRFGCGNCRSFVSDGYLYLTPAYIFDVTDPYEPELVTEYAWFPVPENPDDPWELNHHRVFNIWISGSYAYVATETGLLIVNLDCQ